MDLSRPFSINVDYRDRSSPPAWELRIFADVVLIDKTHDALHPLVYQLKDSMLPLEATPSDLSSVIHKLPHEAFTCLGKAICVDKKKKQILLDTNSTVAYNYLIVVSGSKPIHSGNEEEFSAGVQTLVAALRVKKRMSLSLAAHLAGKRTPARPSSKDTSSPHLSSKCAVGKPMPPHLSPMRANKMGINLNLLNKRLYEVFL